MNEVALITELDPAIGWSIVVYSLLNPIIWIIVICVVVGVICIVINCACGILVDKSKR